MDGIIHVSRHPQRDAALARGMNGKPPGGIERVAKFLNRHKKRAKWESNHRDRAEVNRERANNKSKPTWHGIGHP